MIKLSLINNEYEDVPVIEERKRLEQRAYEQIYRANAEISEASIREHLLNASENYFCQRLVALSPKARVLEIGCGAGQHSIMAAKAGATVIGIDVAEAAVTLATREAHRAGVSADAHFQQGDCEALPFEDQSFDLIIDHEVFSSLEMTRALPEFRRILKPSGVLLGIECLGHNPIFNANRRVNVWRGRRTKWAADHIIRIENLAFLESSFACMSVHYFHLLSVLAAPLRFLPSGRTKKALLSAVTALDHALLTRFTPIQRFSFKAVFEASGPALN